MASEVNCPSCGTPVERHGRAGVLEVVATGGYRTPMDLRYVKDHTSRDPSPDDAIRVVRPARPPGATLPRVVDWRREAGVRGRAVRYAPVTAGLCCDPRAAQGQAKATVKRRPVREKRSAPAGATGSGNESVPEASGRVRWIGSNQIGQRQGVGAEARRAGVVAAVTGCGWGSAVGRSAVLDDPAAAADKGRAGRAPVWRGRWAGVGDRSGGREAPKDFSRLVRSGASSSSIDPVRSQRKIASR